MRQGFLLAALLRLSSSASRPSSGSENPENPNIVPVDGLTGEVEVTVTNLPNENKFELVYMNWRDMGGEIGVPEHRIAPNSPFNPPGAWKDNLGQDMLGQRNIILPYPMGHFLEDLEIAVAPDKEIKNVYKALESDASKNITRWNLLADIIKHNETQIEVNSDGVRSYKRKITNLALGAGGLVAEVVVVLPTWASVLARDPSPTDKRDTPQRSRLEIERCMSKVDDAMWTNEKDANGRPVQDFMHRGNRGLGLGDDKSIINVAFMFPGLNIQMLPGDIAGNGARQGRMWFRDMCSQMVNAKSEFVLVFTPVTYRNERAMRELYHSQGMMWMTTYMKQAYVDPILSSLAGEGRNPTALFTGFSMGGIIATLNAIELARLDTMTRATEMLMHNPYSDMKPRSFSGHADDMAGRLISNHVYYRWMMIHCPESAVREVMEKIMRDTDWVKPDRDWSSVVGDGAKLVLKALMAKEGGPIAVANFLIEEGFEKPIHANSFSGDFFGHDTPDSPNNDGFCINGGNLRDEIWIGIGDEYVDIKDAALEITDFNSIETASHCLSKCNEIENCQFWEYSKDSEKCRYWTAQYWFENVDKKASEPLGWNSIRWNNMESDAMGERNCILRAKPCHQNARYGPTDGRYLSEQSDTKSSYACALLCDGITRCTFWKWNHEGNSGRDWSEKNCVLYQGDATSLQIAPDECDAGVKGCAHPDAPLSREATRTSGRDASAESGGTGGYLSYYQERLEVCYNKQYKKQQSLKGRNTPQKRIYGLAPGKGNPYTLGGVLTMGTPVHTLFSTQTGIEYFDDRSMSKKALASVLGQRTTVMDETMDLTDEIYLLKGKGSNHVLGKIIAYDGHYIQNYRRQGSTGEQSVQVWHVNRFTDKTVGYQANVYRSYDELGFMSRAWQKKRRDGNHHGIIL